jgi:predicted DNA-binding transcriptional regulator YafY
MPANKYALLRYRIIDRCLTNSGRPFPTKEDLRQACEDALYGSDGEQISESTIEKDLWAMRNEGELGFYAPIAYSKAHKGYYYEDANYTINDINLNDDDLDALYFAADTLTQFRDIPLFRTYRSAIDKVVSKLRVNRDPNDRTTDAFIQFEDAPEVVGLEHLEPLVEAIKSNEVVTIEYGKYTDDSVEPHALHPYLLKEYRNRWYLIGFHPEKAMFKTYALDRIHTLKRLNDRFETQANFDPDQFFKYSMGITQLDTAPVDVVLHCEALQAKYFQSRPLHKSQRMHFNDDGSAELRIRVIISFELVSEILSYGASVTVRAPQELKTRVFEAHKSALDRYL